MQLTLLSFPEILVSKVTERLPCQENFLTVYSNEKDIESSSNIYILKCIYCAQINSAVEWLSCACITLKKSKWY